MKTQTPKTIDPRDAELAALREQLAILAPRNQEQTATYERRLAQARREAREQEIIAMTDERRVAAFADAVAHGDGLRMIQTIDSFVPGGCVHFYRIADDATKIAILAAHPNSKQFEIDAAEELPRFVRYTSAILDAYYQREAAGVSEPKPSVPNIQTHAEQAIETSEAQAELLRSVGIEVRRIGKDNKPHYSGFRLWIRESFDETREAFEARYKVDSEFRALIKTGVLRVRDLTEPEVRARLQLARDISVS